MPVIGRRVKRKDIRLIRGDTFRLGFIWERLDLSTGEKTRVDAAETTGDQDTPGGPRYSAVLELRSPDGAESWLVRACDQLTVDGYVSVLLPAGLFTGDQWRARTSGRYRFTVTDAADGSVSTMCWGHFVLVD